MASLEKDADGFYTPGTQLFGLQNIYPDTPSQLCPLLLLSMPANNNYRQVYYNATTYLLVHV